MDRNRETKFIAAVSLVLSALTRAGWECEIIERARYRTVILIHRADAYGVVIGKSLPNVTPSDTWSLFTAAGAKLTLDEITEATR